MAAEGPPVSDAQQQNPDGAAADKPADNSNDTKFSKRTVAIHTGYVGTGYKGGVCMARSRARHAAWCHWACSGVQCMCIASCKAQQCRAFKRSSCTGCTLPALLYVHAARRARMRALQ